MAEFIKEKIEGKLVNVYKFANKDRWYYWRKDYYDSMKEPKDMIDDMIDHDFETGDYLTGNVDTYTTRTGEIIVIEYLDKDFTDPHTTKQVVRIIEDHTKLLRKEMRADNPRPSKLKLYSQIIKKWSLILEGHFRGLENE